MKRQIMIILRQFRANIFRIHLSAMGPPICFEQSNFQRNLIVLSLALFARMPSECSRTLSATRSARLYDANAHTKQIFEIPFEEQYNLTDTAGMGAVTFISI